MFRYVWEVFSGIFMLIGGGLIVFGLFVIFSIDRQTWVLPISWGLCSLMIWGIIKVISKESSQKNMFISALRGFWRLLSKFFIFLGICGLIYTIICLFSDNWKTSIIPMVFASSGMILWGIIKRFSKEPLEKESDVPTDDSFVDFAGEFVSEIAVESVSIIGDVVVGTASTAVDVVSNIDVSP